MSLVPSSRLRNHVIFHCPNCVADRVGRERRAGARAAPGIGGGDYIECTGCLQPSMVFATSHSPVGSSFTYRLIEAARTSAAAILRAGGSTDAALDAALDFVSTFTTERFDASRLRSDLADRWLEMRRRGSLVLLAETITEDAAIALVRAMAFVADACRERQPAMGVVDDCRSLLGLDGRRSLLKRSRRR
jgi:hypothetical protein